MGVEVGGVKCQVSGKRQDGMVETGTASVKVVKKLLCAKDG